MQNHFSRDEKYLAAEILRAVRTCRRSMDDHDTYRRIMDGIHTLVARSERCSAHRDTPRYESVIARIQRMVLAALAITEDTSGR
jgi:hypothetical protein